MIKKRQLHHYFAFLTIALLTACGNNASEKRSVAKKISAKSIYEENCSVCHGPDGKSGALGSKDLSISTLDKSQIVEIITNGKGTMTPFGSVLSKEEIGEVANYLQTLRK